MAPPPMKRSSQGGGAGTNPAQKKAKNSNKKTAECSHCGRKYDPKSFRHIAHCVGYKAAEQQRLEEEEQAFSGSLFGKPKATFQAHATIASDGCCDSGLGGGGLEVRSECIAEDECQVEVDPPPVPQVVKTLVGNKKQWPNEFTTA